MRPRSSDTSPIHWLRDSSTSPVLPTPLRKRRRVLMSKLASDPLSSDIYRIFPFGHPEAWLRAPCRQLYRDGAQSWQMVGEVPPAGNQNSTGLFVIVRCRSARGGLM